MMSTLTLFRDTPWVVCATSCSSCTVNYSNSTEVSGLGPESVNLDSPIPMMVRLKFFISAAPNAVYPVSYTVRTFHVPKVFVVLVEMIVFGPMAFI
ncbi:hypothetical protein DPMN_074992 [Dreissena polymorpha]|uniref:Uncharacterized protein n=1 Tax=Dreissena polymorpha TaxID=45954 RepID=A0A9D3YG03_DREPO|nr:hypothetical protein DPMN_074992 [Dreissena polymorpha]